MFNLIPILFFSLAIFYSTTYKIGNTFDIFNINQKKLTSVPNLLQRDLWESKEMYRAVSALPYIHFHPNFLWAYGIDTLDGYSSIIPKEYVDFWHYGLHKNEFNPKKQYFKGKKLLKFALLMKNFTPPVNPNFMFII